MKKVILLAIMAIASLSVVAGTFYSTRDASRGVNSDLSQKRTLVDIDYFQPRNGLVYSALTVKAYAECTVSGTSTDGNEVHSLAAMYTTIDGSWINKYHVGEAKADASDLIDVSANENMMPYLYSIGNNSLLVYHDMLLPAGMYGTMVTKFTITASYSVVY